MRDLLRLGFCDYYFYYCIFTWCYSRDCSTTPLHLLLHLAARSPAIRELLPAVILSAAVKIEAC